MGLGFLILMIFVLRLVKWCVVVGLGSKCVRLSMCMLVSGWCVVVFGEGDVINRFFWLGMLVLIDLFELFV